MIKDKTKTRAKKGKETMGYSWDRLCSSGSRRKHEQGRSGVIWLRDKVKDLKGKRRAIFYPIRSAALFENMETTPSMQMRRIKQENKAENIIAFSKESPGHGGAVLLSSPARPVVRLQNRQW